MFFLAFSVKTKFESVPPPRKGGQRQNSSFAGGFSDRAPPVPIPNTAVKPVCAHGTAGATLWKSRSSPALYFSAPRFKRSAGRSLLDPVRPAGIGQPRRLQYDARKSLQEAPVLSCVGQTFLSAEFPSRFWVLWLRLCCAKEKSI